MTEPKRGRGRPKGSGADLYNHLVHMARLLCQGHAKTYNAAARDALQKLGGLVTVRHLTRSYKAVEEQLEYGLMRRMAYYGPPKFMPPGAAGKVLAHRPDIFDALQAQVRALHASDPCFAGLLTDTYPGTPLRRLSISALLEVLETAGIEPDFPEE